MRGTNDEAAFTLNERIEDRLPLDEAPRLAGFGAIRAERFCEAVCVRDEGTLDIELLSLPRSNPQQSPQVRSNHLSLAPRGYAESEPNPRWAVFHKKGWAESRTEVRKFPPASGSIVEQIVPRSRVESLAHSRCANSRSNRIAAAART